MMKPSKTWPLRSGALCLLAALPCAHAEPGVSLYGVISTAVRYTANVDGKHNNKDDLVSSGIGGSRWGLQGDEDLGGGEHAVFVLENGFGTDDGQTAYNALFGRQAYAGLSGHWGSLTFGRQYNALVNVGWSFNPLDQSWGNFWSDPLYTGGDVFFQDYRINNSVVYKGRAGPVTVQLDYGFGEQPGSAARGSTVGVGLMYQQNGLALGLAYDRRQSAKVGGNALRNYSAGASYVLGKATVYLGYMGHSESVGQAHFGIAFTGLGYQLTPALHLSGAYYRYRQAGAVTTQFQTVPVVLGDGDAGALSAVADYAFSKRTSVFLEVDSTRARGGAVGRETEYWGGTPVTGLASTKRTGVMLGLRHQF